MERNGICAKGMSNNVNQEVKPAKDKKLHAELLGVQKERFIEPAALRTSPNTNGSSLQDRTAQNKMNNVLRFLQETKSK